MLSTNKIKWLKSLHLPKVRKAENCFVAEGPKIVNEFLNSNFRIKEVYALSTWILAQEKLLQSKDIAYFEIKDSELERISQLKSPNTVFAVIENPIASQFDNQIVENQLVLALDSVQDPGNMGTIIRLADWFGIQHILCSHECADVFSSKVVQSTMGSLIRVQVHYLNLGDFFSTLKNASIYGAMLNADNIYQKKLNTSGILLMGNESKGISLDLQKYINQPISIPAFGNNQAESLNVAVATAIICSEFKRTTFA